MLSGLGVFILVEMMLGLGSSVQQPNIVLMVADDLGWADVPWHDALTIAPTLTGLANSGIILDRHYVQPICSPTRSALMTGKYPSRLGLQHDTINAGEPYGLMADETIIANYMKQLGYDCHGVGKWHLGYCSWALTPTQRGFDSFYGYYNGAIDYYSKSVPDRNHGNVYDFRYNTPGSNGSVNDEVLFGCNGTYSSFQYAARAKALIEEHDQDKPLFLYFPIQDPHFPAEVPNEFYQLYEGKVHNKNRRTLLAMVSAMDAAVETVVTSLKETGMWENTVLIFFSDNGGPIGKMGNGQVNYPLRGGKVTLWEGGIRSPGFVHSPLIEGGWVNSELMHTTDWLPTLTHLAACGLENPLCQGPELGDIDGTNQWQMINGKSKSNRTEILINYDQIWENAAIRMGDWKLLYGDPGRGDWIPPPSSDGQSNSSSLYEKQFNLPYTLQEVDYMMGFTNSRDPVVAEHFTALMRSNNIQSEDVQLYNVATDPYERNEVSAANPDIVKSMLARLEYHKSRAIYPRNTPYDPDSNPSQFDNVWTPWMESC